MSPSNPISRSVTRATKLGVNPHQIVQNLDLARATGKWAQVPQLAAKVIKSVPDYTNSAQVAQVEAQLISLLRERSPRQDTLLVSPAAGSPLAEKLKTIASELPAHAESGTENAVENSFIQTVLLAHIQLVQSDFQGAVNTLSGVSDPSDPSLASTEVAIFKAKAILGAAYNSLGDIDNAVLTYKDPLVSPKTSEAVAWREVLYYNFASLVTSEDCSAAHASTGLDLHALRQYSNSAGKSHVTVGDHQTKLLLLRLFLERASNELACDSSDSQLQGDIQKASLNYGKILSDGVEDESVVEDYLKILIKTWKSTIWLTIPEGRVIDKQQISYSNKVLEVLKKAAFSTFHSPLVMRYHVEVLSALGHYFEAFAAFETYAAYQDKHRIRLRSGGVADEGRRGDTIKGVCNAFCIVIGISIRITRDRLKAKEFADRLSTWLPPIEPNGQTYDNLAETPKSILAKAYGSVAEAYSYYSEGTFTDEEHYRSVIDISIKNYEQSLKTWPENSEINYNYGLLLSQIGDIDRAVETVRNGLRYDKVHLPSWHLLALLLTTRDDYELANKLINSAVENALEENEKGQSRRIENRACIIQMKLTQLAIIEVSTNVDTALDFLPETLSLYGKLFPLTSNSSAKKEFTSQPGKTEPTQPAGTVKSTIKSRRSMGLKKFTTNNTLKSGSKNYKGACLSDVEDEKLSKPSDPVHQRLFQDIWIYIAGVYGRSQMTRDAEESIIEAEHMYRVSADTQVELGRLMAKRRPLHALQQFETALRESPDHLNAVLNLSELILDNSRIGTDVKPKDLSSSSQEIFFSHEDELAAHARIQSLLETQVTKCPGRYSSEAWYFLGCVCGKSDQDKNAEHAFWKSMQLEEIRPVRDYSVSGYYY